MDRDAAREFFHPLFAGTGGIDSWMDTAPEVVLDRLGKISAEPLRLPELNQLLILSHEAGMSHGFFQYFWGSAPDHSWDVRSVPNFDEQYLEQDQIVSLEHLRWGLERFYIDALLYFGSVRTAYRKLRRCSFQDLENFFKSRCYHVDYLRGRGAPLALHEIPRDDRYLVAELACKTMELDEDRDIIDELVAAYAQTATEDRPKRVKDLLAGPTFDEGAALRASQLEFSFDDVLDQEFTSEEELRSILSKHVSVWREARDTALENTRLYLSMVGDLDVYVATSMRTRQDFRDMGDRCEKIFGDPRLAEFHLRYFDPTLSAAAGHEDKGLIECLMVRAAKVLLYFAGTKESYGKDAEAAMALSQGKPVFFVCDEETRSDFYRDVHPLSRLIQYETGVAVGAIAISIEEGFDSLIELMELTLTNKMRYTVDQTRPGYLRLVEPISGSIVRIQTSDPMLRETFWNYYNEVNEGRRVLAVRN